MLSDWLESLLTPCSRPVRALGYLRELRNIKKRCDEWGEAWTEHFERSRALIRTAAARCRQRRKAVVFGSGRLYDVPLDELAAAFREVVLVDIVHPFRTRWRLHRYRNVRPLAHDVTGTVEAVYRAAFRAGTELPRATPDLFCDDPEVDLAASVNLLSQLPCLPVDYLKQAGVHEASAITAYARDLVRAHLDYLRRLPGTVALVADVEGLTVSPTGQVVKRGSTVYDVAVPGAGEEWVWPLVPRRRAYPHHGYHLRVVGTADFKQEVL